MLDNRKYFVAKLEDDEILGFAGILINENFAEIMNIVIRKIFRKQGIGQELLEKLIEYSKDNNFDYIDLEVNEKNLPAIELYKKNNFIENGRRKKYYNNTDDAVLMKLILKKD